MTSPDPAERRRITPRRVGRALALYFGLVVTGFATRCDEFPSTWAPMYVAHHSADRYRLTAMDRSSVHDHGFGITRRDGTTGDLTHRDLNLPFRNFWPLFAERAFGEGPPKHRRAVGAAGPYNAVEVDWPLRLFETVHRTLGREPDDPLFIVELRAARRLVDVAGVHLGPRVVAETLDSVILRWTPQGVTVERHAIPLDLPDVRRW